MKYLYKLSLFVVFFNLVSCSDTSEKLPESGEAVKVKFELLFDSVQNKQFTPKVNLQAQGVTLGKGVSVGGLLKIQGFQLTELADKTFLVKNVNGIMVIESIE